MNMPKKPKNPIDIALTVIEKHLLKKFNRCKTVCVTCFSCRLWLALQQLQVCLSEKWEEKPFCKHGRK